jgi:peptidoglycan hydrolase-like protein with peptidoglycan-binding domain
MPPTTTTTIPPFLQPAGAVLPEVPGGGIGSGANGPEVQAYEQRLADLHFDPGPVDGHYDAMTVYAVQALQKMFDAPRTGRIGAPERFALGVFQYPAPLQPDGGPNRTEVDVGKQYLTLYENWQVKLISPVSTGAGELYCYDTPRENPTSHVCEHANTPSGAFKFERFVNGWDKSPLGQLYNPYYFNGGIAVHGYDSVPTHPASHGCVRIPMYISEYFHPGAPGRPGVRVRRYARGCRVAHTDRSRGPAASRTDAGTRAHTTTGATGATGDTRTGAARARRTTGVTDRLNASASARSWSLRNPAGWQTDRRRPRARR